MQIKGYSDFLKLYFKVLNPHKYFEVIFKIKNSKMYKTLLCNLCK